MTEPSDKDDESILDLLRRAQEMDRGYASFWKFPLDRTGTLEATEVARKLVRFLGETEGLDATALRPTPDGDPPDCEATLADNRLLGIEVTELVDQAMVEHHAAALRRRRRKGASDPPDLDFSVAEWTASSLADAIRERLICKDIPPEKRKGGPYSSYIVAIQTGEPMVTHDLAKQVSETVAFETSWIDRAFLLLSYHPAYADRFPEGYPIIEIELKLTCD